MPSSRKKDKYDKWRKEIEEERRQKIAGEAPEPEDALELENTRGTNEPQEPIGVYNPKPQRRIREPSFGEELSSVFSYPFYGEGRSLMIAGTVFISIIYFLNTSFGLFSLLFTFLKFFLVFYLSAFMFKIIVYSSSGEDELPDWPDIVDFFGDLLQPFFYLISTIVFSFLPTVIYYYFYREISYTNPIFLLTVIWGVFYLPMGLIAVAMFGTLSVLSPTVILPSIKRITSDYFAACASLFIIIAVEIAGEHLIKKIDFPILTIPVYSFLTLYFLAVEMRILGLVYYTNRHRLGWYTEDF